MTKLIAAPLLALLAALGGPVHADSFKVPKNTAFEEECTSCHIAYPPQMLGASSWRAVMSGLSKHFGSDASVDEKRRSAITDFLVANSSGRGSAETRDPRGLPLLRVSESAHFVNEHREVAAMTWKRASIKSPANCAACHVQAAAGDFSERSIRIPK